jgi:hypothetical protein
MSTVEVRKRFDALGCEFIGARIDADIGPRSCHTPTYQGRRHHGSHPSPASLSGTSPGQPRLRWAKPARAATGASNVEEQRSRS